MTKSTSATALSGFRLIWGLTTSGFARDATLNGMETMMPETMSPREKVERAIKDAIRDDAGVGLQMTLTPRFMRGLVDRVLDATAVVDNEANLVSGKPAALASSGDHSGDATNMIPGDHAELARLADLLALYAEARDDEFTVDDVQLLERGTDSIRALIAEVAALRQKADASEAHWKAWAGAKVAEAQRAEHSQLARSTKAERKLADAVEWRPIETAPKDGTRFIGFGPECGIDFMHYQTGRGGRPEGFRDSFIRVFAAGVDDHPTHWLPLPPAPGAEA